MSPTHSITHYGRGPRSQYSPTVTIISGTDGFTNTSIADTTEEVSVMNLDALMGIRFVLACRVLGYSGALGGAGGG